MSNPRITLGQHYATGAVKRLGLVDIRPLVTICHGWASGERVGNPANQQSQGASKQERKQGPPAKPEGGRHADENETSKMLYMDPASVDMRKAI